MFIRVNFVCPFDITNTGLFNANASNHLLHYRHPHHWI
jgi:predicted TIM-barrel enzyme